MAISMITIRRRRICSTSTSMEGLLLLPPTQSKRALMKPKEEYQVAQILSIINE